MLTKAKTLRGYKLNSLDGNFGTVRDFYFDDKHWTVRYLVADTGGWLTDRQVLISPYALASIIPAYRLLEVDLTKKQIEDSPSLDSHKPVSRQFEDNYYGYYGWPVYWGGPYSWGPYPYANRDRDTWAGFTLDQRSWDPHLRSMHDVNGHDVEGNDGAIGHVEDFIIDDASWAVRYLVVNTRNWWPGKKVLVSPQWINRVSWLDSKVVVDLSREAIRQSPEYSEDALLTRDFETGLYGHYNRKGYWVDELAYSPALDK